MDLIRSVEIDVSANSNPRISAPSSPIQLTDGNMVYTFHDKDVDETPPPGFGIGLKIPLYNNHGNTLGLQWHNSWAGDSERLRTVFVGLYASKNLGFITPSVYVGRTFT